MIAYFDTSAIVPLLIAEPSSPTTAHAWNEASRVVSTRLMYAEARAALARARQSGRVSAAQSRAAIRELDDVYAELDVVEIDDALVREARALAEAHRLRGSNAVHLAAAQQISDPDLVLVAGDTALLAAARSVGLSVFGVP